MKLIIAGSRTINANVALYAIEDFFKYNEMPKITEIVSGTAKGVDKTGEYFAELNYLPVKQFPANWDKHGKPAGHIRNLEMAKYADALLLVWDGKSRGSANMKQNMQKLNKPIYEVIIE